MTEDCRQIIDKAIEAVDPVHAVYNTLRSVEDTNVLLQVGSRVYSLKEYKKVIVVAFGKASSAMAATVVDILIARNNSHDCPRISGLVIVKDDHAKPGEVELLHANNVVVREAAHPVPDERSVAASKELLDLVKKEASEDTLVIACISGGGSSLFCAPRKPLSLQDLQATNDALLKSGWSIQDMNVVRKRLEQGKGGRLAVAAYPSHVCSLILSDVLGDPLDLIASGPTVPDTSNWQDAWELVQ